MSDDLDFDPLREADSPLPEADVPGALSPELQAMVDAAVAKRIGREVAAIADAQFAEILTPELFDRLQAATTRALAANLDQQARSAEAAADDAEGRLVYATLVDFVDDMIRPHYRREVTEGNTKKWCPRWWAHGEAFRRLDALWRAWEHLRRDPNTGMSVWWKDHADHHMGKLLDPHGPFSACSVRHGHQNTLPPLPADAPDPALFGTPADPATPLATAAAVDAAHPDPAAPAEDTPRYTEGEQ